MFKKKFAAGEIIINEGDTGKTMFLILSGRVKPYKTINGEILDFPELGDKDFFGEMSLFTDKPRTATVKAVVDTLVLEISEVSFFDKLKESPGFGKHMIKQLILRLSKAHDIISELEGVKKSFEILYKK